MSMYIDAVESASTSVGADIGGIHLKRRLKKVGHGLKKVGKVAALTAIPPVGVAYLANKAIKKRKAKKRASAATASNDSDQDASANEDEDEDNNQETASDDDSDADSGDEMPNDDIGWEEIGDDVDALLAGDDVGDDDVGGRQIARRGAAPARAVGAVTQSKYRKRREYPLGFSSNGPIAAAANAVVTAQPQTLFRATRLVIPSSIAGSFTIQDIKVGNQSQLVASGSLPAALYSELAVGTMQRYDTAAPGILISLSVTNTSAGALAFVAAMVGDAVQ